MSPRNEDQNQQIRDERHDQILAAALRVFAQKGLAAAKISDIAAAAGLSHGLVYHYFRSKDEIFTKLVERALDASLGTIMAAGQMQGSPWERIRTMTETIFSGSYSGDSPYYYMIMLQAFTSDAVPAVAKELVWKQVPLYNDYLVPVIREGQKSGEVASGDPVVLATMYFGMIQGLAVIKAMGGDTVPDPDPEIVLRLFRDGAMTVADVVTNQPAIVPQPGRIAPLFGPVRLETAILNYRGRARGSEWSEQWVKASEMRTNGNDEYQFEESDKSGGRTVIRVRADDWRPLMIVGCDVAGNQNFRIDYQEQTVRFEIPDRKLHKSVKLKGDYYDFHSTAYLFRAYPFGSGRKIGFNLVMDGRGGSPVGGFGMVVQEVGRETVQVPAGSFDCYKLEMGLGGMAGSFAAGFKFYFWYTADEPHFLVKYQDKQGNLSELVKRGD